MSRIADPSHEVTSSQAGHLRAVNQSLIRIDAAEKISGATRYAADLTLPGMLHASLIRSPMPSARIVKRDTAAALSIPGVVAVLLAEDVPNNIAWVDVPGQQTEVSALKASMQVLARETVRFQGEPVALIVAETEEALAEAEAVVQVEYQEMAGVYDPLEALQPEAPKVHEGGNLLAEWRIDTGDPSQAFAQADVVVEGEYVTQFVDHAYIETEAGVAWLDEQGVINIRASTQVIEHYRDVARILGVPESKVRVVAPYVGGGFGGKEDMTVEAYLALAVMRTGRPVRMIWTRQESLLARPKRHRMFMKYRSAARSDGTVLGHQIEIVSDAGAYAFLSALVLLYASVNAAGPYQSPNLKLRAKAVYTNNPPCSAMRGFGGMQVVFGYETQMDKLAKALRIDAVELRKRNRLERGDQLPVGQTLETKVLLAECMDAALEVAGQPQVRREGRIRRGRGLACNLQPYGRLVWLNDSASAWMGFELDGSLQIRCGVPDIGGGQASSLAQIASEVLGVPMDRISVAFGDSSRTPLAGTTTATRQLYMSGNAALLTATVLKEQILDAVAEASAQPRASLRLEPQGVVGPQGTVNLAQAVAMAIRLGWPIQTLQTFRGPRGQEVGRQLISGRVFPDFTFGCHVADVEVDVETGAVKVIGYVAAHDVGLAINPCSVEGQIAGAVAMGIGSTLMEEVVLKDGYNLSSGFFQYLVPSACDLPDLHSVILESGEGMGPFGARGIGEPPIGPCAAAIASAIEDAIGVRPTHLPITSERIVQLLSERPQRAS